MVVVVGGGREISTPFVNIRGFMVDANLKSHWYYKYNSLLVVVLFVGARLVVGIPGIFECWTGLSTAPAATGFHIVYFVLGSGASVLRCRASASAAVWLVTECD